MPSERGEDLDRTEESHEPTVIRPPLRPRPRVEPVDLGDPSARPLPQRSSSEPDTSAAALHEWTSTMERPPPRRSRRSPQWAADTPQWMRARSSETGPHTFVHRSATFPAAPPVIDPVRITRPPPEPVGDAARRVIGLLTSILLIVGLGALLGTRHISIRAAILIFVLVVVFGFLIVKALNEAVRRARRRREGRQYEAYLNRVDAQVGETAKALVEHVDSTIGPVRTEESVWTRPPGAGALRVYLGRASLPSPIAMSVEGTDEWDSVPRHDLASKLAALLRRRRVIEAIAISGDLERGPLAVSGPRREVLNLSRSIVTQLVRRVGPDDLQLALVSVAGDQVGDWEWCFVGPHRVLRVVAPLGPNAAFLECARLSSTHRVVVVDAGRWQERTPPFNLNAFVDRLVDAHFAVVVVIDTIDDAPAQTHTRMDLTTKELQTAEGTIGANVETDSLDAAAAESLVGALAGRRPYPLDAHLGETDSAVGSLPDLRELLTRGSARATPERRWPLLTAPIGVKGDGDQPFEVDLREAAAGGQGPHGMLIGASGFGKSAFLRTLLAGLLATHSVNELNLMLIDYKTGDAFDDFRGVPHLAGLVTDLDGDAALVERVRLALRSELRRRADELVRFRRDHPELTKGVDRRELLGVHRKWCEENGKDSIPALLVVIDEFGEFMAAHPDILGMLESVCRLGRSNAVHFLFSTQTADASVIRRLERHLRWRACLKVNTAEESRTVLQGSTAAFDLPPVPGLAIIKVDETLNAIRTAYADAQDTKR